MAKKKKEEEIRRRTKLYQKKVRRTVNSGKSKI